MNVLENAQRIFSNASFLASGAEDHLNTLATGFEALVGDGNFSSPQEELNVRNAFKLEVRAVALTYPEIAPVSEVIGRIDAAPYEL